MGDLVGGGGRLEEGSWLEWIWGVRDFRACAANAWVFSVASSQWSVVSGPFGSCTILRSECGSLFVYTLYAWKDVFNIYIYIYIHCLHKPVTVV
jgi:hypothetical protein